MLERNGWVAVPALGVFMLHRQPSVLQQDGLLLAPRWSISFDAAARTGSDDALCRSIALREACSNDAATKILTTDVDRIKAQLASEGSAEIGLIGTLKFDNGTIVFEQDAAWNLPGWSFNDFALQPLDTQSVKPEIVVPDEDERRETFLRSLRRTASGAAAIAGFALVAFIASQLPQRNTVARSASLYHNDTAVNVGITSQTGDAERAPIMLVFNTPSDGTAAVDMAESIPAKPGKYCLVVASLASKADALIFINGRPDMHILEKDGRFRVYTLNAETFEALQTLAQKENVYATFPSAWICRSDK